MQLVAHDWGAAGGLLFAQRHPERVERIVLVNALPLTGGFRWQGLARLWRRPVLGELAMGSVNRWLLARWLRRGSARPGTGPTRASTPSGSSSTRARSGRSCGCTETQTSRSSPRRAPG